MVVSPVGDEDNDDDDGRIVDEPSVGETTPVSVVCVTVAESSVDEEVASVSVVCVVTVGSSVDGEATSVSVVCVTTDVAVAVTIVEVAPLSAAEVLVKVVVSVSAVVIVVPIRPPPRVGIAYGGSKRPSRPQALHFSKRSALALEENKKREEICFLTSYSPA